MALHCMGGGLMASHRLVAVGSPIRPLEMAGTIAEPNNRETSMAASRMDSGGGVQQRRTKGQRGHRLSCCFHCAQPRMRHPSIRHRLTAVARMAPGSASLPPAARPWALARSEVASSNATRSMCALIPLPSNWSTCSCRRPVNTTDCNRHVDPHRAPLCSLIHQRRGGALAAVRCRWEMHNQSAH